MTSSAALLDAPAATADVHGADVITVPWGDDRYALEVRVFECPNRRDWPAHVHAEHELIWCSRGVVEIAIGDRRWRLTANSVLYVPGGREHAVRALGRAAFSCTFLRPRVGPLADRPTAMAATPLLGELLRYLARVDVDGAARTDAERVVLALLQPAAQDWSVAMPTDPRARQVADALLADPADSRTLAEWGRSVGAGARTLTRLFQQELGVSFQDWRAKVRVYAACSRLAAGGSIVETSSAVGFSTPSAFAESFRRVVGTSPREYRRRHR